MAYIDVFHYFIFLLSNLILFPWMSLSFFKVTKLLKFKIVDWRSVRLCQGERNSVSPRFCSLKAPQENTPMSMMQICRVSWTNQMNCNDCDGDVCPLQHCSTSAEISLTFSCRTQSSLRSLQLQIATAAAAPPRPAAAQWATEGVSMVRPRPRPRCRRRDSLATCHTCLPRRVSPQLLLRWNLKRV